MLRTCLRLAGVVACICFTVSSAAADEECHDLVFTDCPDKLAGSICDTLTYRLQAVDQSSDKQVPAIHYFMVSGPGQIDINTGLWTFDPTTVEIQQRYRATVRVLARKGRGKNKKVAYCEFDVAIRDMRPYYTNTCGTYETVLPGEEVFQAVGMSDEDLCQTPQILAASISPEPAGEFEYDSIGQWFRFAPSSEDSGLTFEVKLEAKSGGVARDCSLYYNVFETEPVKLSLGSVVLDDAGPGDTVEFALTVEACPVDLENIRLEIEYDHELLAFVEALPGDPFYSIDNGCGWQHFESHLNDRCAEGTTRTVLLRADAVGLPSPTDPTCFLPDNFPAVLATLRFVTTDNLVAGDHFVPLRFFWCDCGSNLLTSHKPYPKMAPLAVYDYDGTFIEPGTIPGYSGANDACFETLQSTAPRIRQVEYYNGGVQLNAPDLESPYQVRIGVQKDVRRGTLVDLPVTLENVNDLEGLSGFDLLIGYHASAMTFQLATEGALYDSCGWEYFTYRYGPLGDCGSACPSGMLRVIGIAETNNGDFHPGCDNPGPGYVQPDQLPVTLASLRFLVSNDLTLRGAWLPVRFFWYDCGDNVLANSVGQKLFLSYRLYEYRLDMPVNKDAPLPSYFGAPDECFVENPEAGIRAIRMVDFYNGGIEVFSNDTGDSRGDINLNDIPFEIADAVMYANYFIEGLDAFPDYPPIGTAGSVAASDVNSDGIPLTLEDFVYEIRVVVGDAPPVRGQSEPPVPMSVSVNETSGVVEFSCDESIGAIRVVVHGEVTPSLLDDDLDMMYGHDSGQTRILLYSFEQDAYLTSGPFLQLPPGTEIVEITAATYDARAVTVSIVSPAGDLYRVTIGLKEDVSPGSPVVVAVNLNGVDTTLGLGGFDLMLQYNSASLTFLGGAEGELMSTCGWEYFTYRSGTQIDCGGAACPSGVLNIVAIAETNNGAIHPGCDSPNPGYVQRSQLPGTLFTMSFLVANDPVLNCGFEPIRFIWYECENNALTSTLGDVSSVSAEVYDYDGTRLTADEQFPTYRGVRDDCPVGLARHVDFYNGGLKMACSGPIDTRGDLNANGIPFEIADAVTYQNYFMQGLDAFGDHKSASVVASDANYDGYPLTVPDFVFLLRVLQGEQSVPPGSGEDCPRVALRADVKEIRLTTEDSLGAALLIIDGYPTPTLLASGMDMGYVQVGGQTRVLIYSYEAGRSFGEGPLMSFEGGWRLISVELSSYTGLPCLYGGVTITEEPRDGDLPTTFELSQNYPNPFNPSTTIAYDLPAAASVQIQIYNVAGQKVRTLIDRAESAGNHTVEWDGCDDYGGRVSSGVYLYRLTAGETVLSRKMMLLK
jgi:hypothetical protein